MWSHFLEALHDPVGLGLLKVGEHPGNDDDSNKNQAQIEVVEDEALSRVRLEPDCDEAEGCPEPQQAREAAEKLPSQLSLRRKIF